MEIKEISIKGFKSLGDITISNPNPFTVFVGPNAAGKSNIFEALEFVALCNIMDPFEAVKFFGSSGEILNQLMQNNATGEIQFRIDLGQIKPELTIYFKKEGDAHSMRKSSAKSLHAYVAKMLNEEKYLKHYDDPTFLHFSNFSRIFIGKSALVKRQIQDDTDLSFDASNLEKVLKRILKSESDRNEIFEILELLIPGFKNIEIKSEELSGSDHLLIYEQGLNKPLSKRLISDGTYNIIAILVAIYQSSTPQFLCIEEPENGLNPKVVKLLVQLFRDKCKEKGHYIWLNTHSQTLVSELKSEEIILVDKVNGLTQIKQIAGIDLHGLKMDEALFTNALGGGIPW